MFFSFLKSKMPNFTIEDVSEAVAEALRRRLDVICAKQRQGPAGTDRQRYFAEFDFIDDDREAAQ